jgi:hypothetical protein
MPLDHETGLIRTVTMLCIFTRIARHCSVVANHEELVVVPRIEHASFREYK